MNGDRPGISPEFLAAAGVIRVEEPEPQLRIPYYGLDGKPTGHWRSRLLQPRPDGQKYDQTSGSGCHVYFTHLVLEPASSFYLTEGEFKAMSLREAGYQVIGLPSLHCYSRDGEDIPRLLPGILEAVQLVKPTRIYFVGDSDTVTNLEYYRSGYFLERSIPGEVALLQLPIDGPKGIDDLRASLNGAFQPRVELLESTAYRIGPKESFLTPARIRLENSRELISSLPPQERERHLGRVIHMAALARMSSEPVLAIEHFCELAKKVVGLNKEPFEKAIENEINSIRNVSDATAAANDSGEDSVQDLEDYYEEIKHNPWPVEIPLVEIFREHYEQTETFICAPDWCRVLGCLWTSFTYVFRQSPYLPMLIFTSPEYESGKTSFMILIGNRLLPTGTSF